MKHMSDHRPDHHDPEDVRWLELVRDALSDASVVPPSVREAGYAAYAWRTIDAELAELTFDSTRSDPALAGSRSNQAPLRSLTFSSSAITIELEVEPNALLGQLVPAQTGSVIILLRDGTSSTVPVLDLGCFAIEPIPDQPFRIQLDGDSRTVTDWITL